MRPNLVISPEELGRDDIEPGVPPAEVLKWSFPPTGETELVLMRGLKTSYPDGVVSFWRAADGREEVDYSDKCKELSETEAVERVRSFIRGIDATFRFELRSPLVAAQEMDVGPWMYITILIETAREYIVVRYSSTA